MIFLLQLIFVSLYTSNKPYAVAKVMNNPIISFCSGSSHSCAVFDIKKAKCWGFEQSFGKGMTSLGDSFNEIGDNIPYLNISNSELINNVFCGDNNVCFQLESGFIKCIGWNDSGHLGLGLNTTIIGEISGYVGDLLPFVNVGKDLHVLDMSIGFSHSCVKVVGNKVKCFGSNYYGKLGLGNNKSFGESLSQMGDNLPFVNLGVNTQVISIHSASHSNCALLLKPNASAQRIKCWGRNNKFQLGYGDTNDRGDQVNEMGDHLPLVDLGTESRVKQIGIGEEHICAVLVDENMKCWGFGGNSQLGSGSMATISATGDALPYVLVGSKKKIKTLGVGIKHNCVLFDDDLTIKCFGWNLFGQLGQGDRVDRGGSPATMIPNLTAVDLGTASLKIASMKVGRMSNTIIFVDNSVKCYGMNANGECAVGAASFVGSKIEDMGKGLKHSRLFSPDCNAYAKKTCKGDGMCVWDKVGNTNTCRLFDCNNYKNKNTCLSYKGKCDWKDNQCKLFNCMLYASKKQCLNNSKWCYWTDTECREIFG